MRCSRQERIPLYPCGVVFHMNIQCIFSYHAFMYIDIVPNRNPPPAVLLRESYREGKKVKKGTLANLSSLSPQQIDAIRQVLKGSIPPAQAFEILFSRHHGHVHAVQSVIKKLALPTLLASRPSRQRSLVLAMLRPEPDRREQGVYLPGNAASCWPCSPLAS